MVAITVNPFVQRDDHSVCSDHSIISLPVTPTASDCLSLTSENNHESSSTLQVTPVKRDPALLIERLEQHSRKRMVGKRKRRQAANEAALAVLVEGCEEEPWDLMKPYRSAFTQLLESPVNMMVWRYFTNLSEEDQRLYLAGPKQRAQLLQGQLKETSAIRHPREENAKQSMIVKQQKAVVLTDADVRALHPAALPEVNAKLPVWGDDAVLNVNAALLDPILEGNFKMDHFGRTHDSPISCGLPCTNLVCPNVGNKSDEQGIKCLPSCVFPAPPYSNNSDTEELEGTGSFSYSIDSLASSSVIASSAAFSLLRLGDTRSSSPGAVSATALQAIISTPSSPDHIKVSENTSSQIPLPLASSNRASSPSGDLFDRRACLLDSSQSSSSSYDVLDELEDFNEVNEDEFLHLIANRN